MSMPLVGVVQGPPASGKTTVAREIAQLLRLPLLMKDTVKEALFEGLGTGDLEWSQRLGAGTYEVLAALVEEFVNAGASVVLEGNFVRGSDLERRLATLPARFVQIHCSAPLEVLLERYGSRARHAGHVDGERMDAVREAVASHRHDPLDLPGETIPIDTSAPVDIAALAARLAVDGR